MSEKKEACDVCAKPFSVAWCDHHGIAQCVECGTPYTILHYEGNKRVEKPPECLFSETGIEKVREFHKATGAKWSAVAAGLSFPGGYDVATKADIQAAVDYGLLKETDHE